MFRGLSGKRLVALAWLAMCGLSSAAECTLDRARYSEERSGAAITFQRFEVATHGTTITGLFALELPNIDAAYSGEIGWSAGRNTRPIGSIAQPCTEAEAAEWPNACWLWSGQVYAIGNETVEMIEDAQMLAPNTLLLAEFGRSLLMNETFAAANPDLFAFDVFTLDGCETE